MECTRCAGDDDNCPVCKGWGRERLTTCPKEIVAVSTWRLLQFTDFAERGAWPLTGGVLDQTQSFADACQIAWREDGYWKRKKSL